MRNEVLHEFLCDVAQGVFGPSTLDYSRIYAFMNRSTAADLDQLQEYFWEYTSLLTNPEDIDIQELECFILEVVERK